MWSPGVAEVLLEAFGLVLTGSASVFLLCFVAVAVAAVHSVSDFGMFLLYSAVGFLFAVFAVAFVVPRLSVSGMSLHSDSVAVFVRVAVVPF